MKRIIIAIVLLAAIVLAITYLYHPTAPAESADTPLLPQSYESTERGFSLRYLPGFTVSENYRYEALGPGKEIGGVKFTIPKTIAEGTNLSKDSYISVEQIATEGQCNASLFLSPGAVTSELTDAEVLYSFGSSSGAGAGNRYVETVYALPNSSPCTAVRYFIHSTVLENYSEGTVEEFDRITLLASFDQIRRTLVLK